MSTAFPHIRGVLMKTDIPTKQLIMYLNDANNGRIVLKDLDDIHVLVDAKYVEFIKSEIEQTMDKHNFERAK